MIKKNLFIFIIICFAVVVFVEKGISSSRTSWPKNDGVYIAKSSETIPYFPNVLSGYKSENNRGYWDEPFASKGRLRIFQANVWTEIPDFPGWANRCGEGMFMIRWRSASPDVRIESAMAYEKDMISTAKKGVFGYMYGTNCEKPWFKFSGTPNTMVDIYYEVKFWTAAP